ncbi:MFS transporter [Cellulosimicrobium composti]|uniref:MFS transporter n=1 Tax=Cellulosimicrobium composti TaxID=2672572 RepID=UPI00046395DE|nr:putative MFS family arabinose efflux permease [Cellulosimicrobium cellulans J34]SMF29323.1 Predicted arabinose efflux permease, MFS family [Cellulosimicrobium cellulans J1]
MTAPGRGAAPLFPLRSVVLGAFVPTLLLETGVGAMLPVVAVTATGRGASLTVAGLVAALVPIGKILFDLPAGALAQRLGDRVAMLLAGGVATAAFTTIAVTPGLAGLAAGVLALGASTAVFNLARQAYLTEITPPLRRARVLSTLAGVHRVGLFLGPFAGAAVIAASDVQGAFWLGTGAALAAVAVLAVVRPEPAPGGAARAHRAGAPRVSIAAVAREHRRLFATLGVAILLVAAVRGARQTVIPLWGEHLGLDAEVTSLVFGVSGALDMLLFYPAGKVMDRFGRLWVAVPSMLTMAGGLALLPFAHTVGAVTVVAALLGVGNGMGSGIVMTLGADVAPAAVRPTFLSVWRLFQDTGDALGPLVLAAGAAVGSLAAGVWATAALGAGSAAALARWVPRYSLLANLVRRDRGGPGSVPDGDPRVPAVRSGSS